MSLVLASQRAAIESSPVSVVLNIKVWHGIVKLAVYCTNSEMETGLSKLNFFLGQSKDLTDLLFRAYCGLFPAHSLKSINSSDL